jgi:hypothetical protein
MEEFARHRVGEWGKPSEMLIENRGTKNQEK